MAPGDKNPWAELTTNPPFVLPHDKQAIEDYNAACKTEFKIQTKIFPEPFIGRPNAPILILTLNPGFGDQDHIWHANPEFADRLKRNLAHDPSLEFPFYMLDPTIVRDPRSALDQTVKATDYWVKKLKPLTEKFKPQLVSKHLLLVEFFPYHSRKFNHGGLGLPSQQYSFHLVSQAIQRGALILQLRGARHWNARVPELSTYGRLFRAKYPRNGGLSPCNFEEGFTEAVDELRKAQGA